MEDFFAGFVIGALALCFLILLASTPFDNKFIELAAKGSYCIERNVSDLTLKKCYEIKEIK